MKVLVEIHDTQIVEALRDSIDRCLSTSLPRSVPFPPHEAANLFSALEYCRSANDVIEHFGGSPVDLRSVQPYPAFLTKE